jgi:hypothetical protein
VWNVAEVFKAQAIQAVDVGGQLGNDPLLFLVRAADAAAPI